MALRADIVVPKIEQPAVVAAAPVDPSPVTNDGNGGVR